MAVSARTGRYELCAGRSAPAEAKRLRPASAGEALLLLRRLRLSSSVVRRLVGGSGRRGRDADGLRVLAGLVARGRYVLLEHPPPARIVMVRDEPVEAEAEVFEPAVAEAERDSRPPAIVPDEYPRCAARIEGGLWAAEGEAERRIERELFRGLAPEPDQVVAQVYREVAERGGLAVTTVVNQAVQVIERQLHSGGIPVLAQMVPQVFVDIAASKGSQIVAQVGSIADRLDQLLFRDVELSRIAPREPAVREGGE